MPGGIHIGVVVLKIVSSQISLVKPWTPSCIRNFSNTSLSMEEIRGVSTSVLFQVKASRRSDVRKFLIIYTHLNSVTTNRDWKIIVFIVKIIIEFFPSALALINTGVYHIDPVWWQIVGGSQWSIITFPNEFNFTIAYCFNNYIIKLKRQLSHYWIVCKKSFILII